MAVAGVTPVVSGLGNTTMVGGTTAIAIVINGMDLRDRVRLAHLIRLLVGGGRYRAGIARRRRPRPTGAGVASTASFTSCR